MLLLISKSQYLRVSLALVVICVAWGVSYPAQAQKKIRYSEFISGKIEDPIFDIHYDPHQVHFGLLETSVLAPSCGRFFKAFKPLPKHLTLYAQFINASTSIYVVGKGVETRIFVIRNAICDTGYAGFSIRKIHFNPPDPTDSPVLSDAEISGLFKDAIIRYEKAYGGKTHFLKSLELSRVWKKGGCKEPEDVWCPGPYDNPIPKFVLEILISYRQ